MNLTHFAKDFYPLFVIILIIGNFSIAFIIHYVEHYRKVHNLFIIWRIFNIFGFTLLAFYLFFIGLHTTSNTEISTRIKNISQDLSSASTELSNIQKELEERIEFVENLKTEAEVAENMISLTDEQVSAIQSKLNQELSSSGRQSLFQGILISTFFFVLGYVVNWLKTKSKEKFTDNSTDRLSQYSDVEIDAALNLLASLKSTDNSKSTKTK